MRSSFSRRMLAALCAALLFSCAGKRDENERRYIPAIDTSKSGLKLAPPADESLLGDLYEPSLGAKACDWLAALPQTDLMSERFRLLGSYELSDGGSVLPITGVEGRVDIGASPLYQYALLSQAIPDRQEFLALLDQEYQKASSFGDILKLGIARKLLAWGFMDVYNLRNKVIQERMDEALPGSFEKQESKFIFLNSIPGAVLQNGNPMLSRLSIGENDDAQTRLSKFKRLSTTLQQYRRSSRIFSDGSWETFSSEAKRGLSVAIRALSSKDVSEQACATVIFHRSFAQLLTIMGYSRPYVEEKNSIGVLPSFARMLVSPESETYSVCPSPGSFVDHGRRVMLSRADISNSVSRVEPFELSASPYLPVPCSEGATVPFDPVRGGALDVPAERTASASELLAFLDGVVNFMTAFNPGAPWWRNPDNQVGFPLSPFESLDRIKTSGALLPTDAHALSLGYLSMAFDLFEKRFMIFVNADGKMVRGSGEAAGIRISEEPYKTGSAAPVRTTITASNHINEIAFKLSQSLAGSARWKAFAEDELNQEIANTKDPRKKQSLQQDFEDFVAGMYGAKDNLDIMTGEGQGSLRAQVKDLKLVAALLSLRFVKREGGRVTCYSELVLDPASGRETPKGQCSVSEEQAWKYGLSLAARSFQSPLFAELAGTSLP